MTGIVVDVYKNEIFVFADGMVTRGDFIDTVKYDKVHKIDLENIVAFCGSLQIVDQAVDLISEGKTELEHIKTIEGSGDVIWVTPEGASLWGIDNEDDSKDSKSSNYTVSLNVKSFPLFFGSGADVLSGAHGAIVPSKAKNRESYLALIKEVYLAASNRISSMGPLHSFETVKIAKKPKASK